MNRLVIVLSGVSVLSVVSLPSFARADGISFIRDVAPILKERCYACHDSKKKSGKYDMTTFAKLMAGGANGEAIVAGKLAESDLHALMVTKDERRMPPRDKGEAVPMEKSAVIAKWIEEGAKLDAGISPQADLLRELRIRWQPPLPAEKYAFPAVVTALAFSPDSQRLVTGGTHEVLVWNAADGKLLQRIRTRAERAYAIVFLDRSRIAVAGGRPGQEGDVVVYDLGDGRQSPLDGVNDKAVRKQILFDGDDSVLCLALSADGKQLAAGGTDRAIRVWNWETGKLESTIENHADWVLGVAFSADGKKLLSAGRDKLAKIWDLERKEPRQSVPDHQSTVFAVAFRADGTVGYSVGADRSLRMWRVGGDGKQIRSTAGHGDDVLKLALSPDGKQVATGSVDKSVRIWEAEKLTQLRTLTGLNDVVYTVAFSPDGKRVSGGAYNGNVAVWSVADGKIVTQFVVKP
jgi:WD40 repeat protein